MVRRSVSDQKSESGEVRLLPRDLDSAPPQAAATSAQSLHIRSFGRGGGRDVSSLPFTPVTPLRPGDTSRFRLGARGACLGALVLQVQAHHVALLQQQPSSVDSGRSITASKRPLLSSNSEKRRQACISRQETDGTDTPGLRRHSPLLVERARETLASDERRGYFLTYLYPGSACLTQRALSAKPPALVQPICWPVRASVHIPLRDRITRRDKMPL
jgi:hypothetical protein